MRSWEQQAWRFRKSLMYLDLATVVAFAEEVQKNEYRRYNYGWSERDKHTYMPSEGYGLLFQRLHEKKLDSATMGYLRIRIDEQDELSSRGFERLPDYSSVSHMPWLDKTWLQVFAHNLKYFVENREKIHRNESEFDHLICDCANQFWRTGCEHRGFFSERAMHYKERDLSVTSMVVGIPIGLIFVAFIFINAIKR